MKFDEFEILIGVMMAVMLVGSNTSGDTTIPTPPIISILDPTADAYTDSGNPTTNFGTSSFLQIASQVSDIPDEEVWVNFTVTSIPANAQVTDCGLKFFTQSSNANTKDYFYVSSAQITSTWTESGITYNNKPTVSGTTWQRTKITNESVFTVIEVPLMGLCQGWVNGSFSNFGVYLRGNVITPSQQPTVTWASRDIDRPGERPILVVEWLSPVVTVYPFYYCDGGPCELGVFSGSGLAPWLWKVEVSEDGGGAYKRVNPESISTNISTSLRIRVKDFFDNELYNTSKTITTNPYYWDIPIPYRLLKVSNQRDYITTISVVPAGGTPITMDLLPREIWSAPLKSAITYYVNFTLKDENQNAIQTLSLQRTMSQARSYIVNGTTITEVITNIDGLSTTIKHLQFVSPITVEGENLPFVPLVRLDPSDAIPATLSNYPVQLVRYHAVKNGTGDPIALLRPYDKNLPSADVITLSDEIYLAGTWARIWFNDTKDSVGTGDDTTLGTTTAPLSYWSPISADMGKNISVDTTGGSNVRADRSSVVRTAENFNWSYNADENLYSVNVIIENGAPVAWTDIVAYFAFPKDVSPDLASVRIYDMDNANIELVAGQHFSADGLGVYLALTSLAAQANRNFHITFAAKIGAEFAVLRLEATSAIADNAFTGTAFRARVTYAQPAGADFLGDIIITMNIADPSFAGRDVDMASLVVVDANTGSRISSWYPHPTQGNLLILPDMTIRASTVANYDIYFAYKPASSEAFGGVSAFLASEGGLIVFMILIVVILVLAVDSARSRLRKRP